MASGALTIPESILDEYRRTKMPMRAQRESLSRSVPLFQLLREQVAELYAPLPSLSAGKEEHLHWAGGLMSWLGERVETRPAVWTEPVEQWNSETPEDLRNWSRAYAQSRYERDFTPEFGHLVIACGFAVGELMRVMWPQSHWGIVFVPRFEPHNRLNLVNRRVRQGYDPRVNFYTCCLQSFVSREVDPGERVVVMLEALVRGA